MMPSPHFGETEPGRKPSGPLITAYGRALLAAHNLWMDATHDYLTELPNASTLAPNFDNRIRRREPIIILMADFEHFGEVNRLATQSGGDRALKEGSQRIRESLMRESDAMAFRIGGDEFLMLARPREQPEENSIYPDPGTFHEQAERLAVHIKTNVESSPGFVAFNEHLVRIGKPESSLGIRIGHTIIQPGDPSYGALELEDHVSFIDPKSGAVATEIDPAHRFVWPANGN